jgi:hypothetical protein
MPVANSITDEYSSACGFRNTRKNASYAARSLSLNPLTLRQTHLRAQNPPRIHRPAHHDASKNDFRRGFVFRQNPGHFRVIHQKPCTAVEPHSRAGHPLVLAP